MRIAGELLQRAVAEQDDPAVADELGSMVYEQPLPFVRFVQRLQIVALTDDQGARFVEQRQDVASPRATIGGRGSAQRDGAG